MKKFIVAMIAVLALSCASAPPASAQDYRIVPSGTETKFRVFKNGTGWKDAWAVGQDGTSFSLLNTGQFKADTTSDGWRPFPITRDTTATTNLISWNAWGVSKGTGGVDQYGDAGARAKYALYTPFKMRWTVGSATARSTTGIGNNGAWNYTPSSIKWSFEVMADGTAYALVDGAQVAGPFAYTATTKFRIDRNATSVVWYMDDVQRHTVATADATGTGYAALIALHTQNASVSPEASNGPTSFLSVGKTNMKSFTGSLEVRDASNVTSYDWTGELLSFWGYTPPDPCPPGVFCSWVISPNLPQSRLAYVDSGGKAVFPGLTLTARVNNLATGVDAASNGGLQFWRDPSVPVYAPDIIKLAGGTPTTFNVSVVDNATAAESFATVSADRIKAYTQTAYPTDTKRFSVSQGASQSYKEVFNIDHEGDVQTLGSLTSESYLRTLLPAPSLTATPWAGGTLVERTHYYKITAINAQGETTQPLAVTASVGGANRQVILDWNEIPGATGYRIWFYDGLIFCGSFGCSQPSYLKYIPIAGGSTVTYTHTGGETPTAGTFPTTNTAWTSSVGSDGVTASTFTGRGTSNALTLHPSSAPSANSKLFIMKTSGGSEVASIDSEGDIIAGIITGDSVEAGSIDSPGQITGNTVSAVVSVSSPVVLVSDDLIIEPFSAPPANTKLFDVRTAVTAATVASIDAEGDAEVETMRVNGQLVAENALLQVANDNDNALSIVSSLGTQHHAFLGTGEVRLGIAGGKVGIGGAPTSFPLTVNKADATNSYAQFTNSVTGSTGTDGLLVGTQSTGQGVMWMQDNQALRFATNNTERVQITATGALNLLTGGSGFAVLQTENGAQWNGKDTGGTVQQFLIPRYTDNATYLNYGTGGFKIRNNAATTFMEFGDTGTITVKGTVANSLLLKPASAPAANTKLFNVEPTGTTTSLASIDAEGDAVVQNLTVNGTCTGCGGSPATAWTTFTPTLTASTGTWSSGTVFMAKYLVQGKKMTIVFDGGGTTTNASGALYIAVPGGYVPKASGNSLDVYAGAGIASVNDNGTAAFGWAVVQTAAVSGANQIAIFRNVAGIGGNWTAGTTRVGLMVNFEIE